ncbi:MAG: IclR family transcriptional regulator, partial [Sphingopyxis sp.]
MGKSDAASVVTQRNLAILEAIICDDGQLTLAGYAALLNLPVATVHRHVQALIGAGFLVRHGQRRLLPGPRLCRLAPHLDERQWLIRAAAPLIEKLAAKTRCVVQLGTLDQDMVTYRLKRGVGGAAAFTREGMQLEAYCSAIGKILLAHLPDAERAAYLAAGPFPALTPSTITDPQSLAAELAHVRAIGH